jgi:hypothetical protein
MRRASNCSGRCYREHREKKSLDGGPLRPYSPRALESVLPDSFIVSGGETNVKELMLGAVLLLAPMTATADYVDVIEFNLTNGAPPEYLFVVRDFNVWAEDTGYQAEIAVKPCHPAP